MYADFLPTTTTTTICRKFEHTNGVWVGALLLFILYFLRLIYIYEIEQPHMSLPCPPETCREHAQVVV